MAVPPFIDPEVQEALSLISESSALPASRVPTVVNVVDGTNTAIFQRNSGPFCPNGGKWERQNVWDHKTKKSLEYFQTND